MFCRNCGTELSDNTIFCVKCGEPTSIQKIEKSKSEKKKKKSKRKWVIGLVLLVIACVAGVAVWIIVHQWQAKNTNRVSVVTSETEEKPGDEISFQNELVHNEKDILTDDFQAQNVGEKGAEEESESLENVVMQEEYARLKGVNVVQNPGFETSDFSQWTCLENSSVRKCVVYEENDPFGVIDWVEDCYDGNYTFHFWSEYADTFDITQTFSDENITTGKYTASVQIQGDEVGSNAVIYLFVRVNDQTYMSENIQLTGFQEWKNPIISDIPINKGDTVTIGVHVEHAAGGWGTIDEFDFALQ